MNSGENLRRAASTAVRSTFWSMLVWGLVVGFDEAVAATHEVGDFVGAEVGGHKDDGLREIDAAVVTERESGFIQHAEEQLPESVAGFFDFIEEQEG